MFLAYEHYYWLYAWIPVFGAFIWFGESRVPIAEARLTDRELL